MKETMGNEKNTIVCQLKLIRQSKGLSQSLLAEQVGVKRQAIYDMESGKYVPNTALALRLSAILGCRVENLFYETPLEIEHPVTVVEPFNQNNTRIEVAKIRGKLVGYPLAGDQTFKQGFRPADGLLKENGRRVELFSSEESLDRSIVLLGCDPAFSILKAHVMRQAPDMKVHCRFKSSRKALEGLAAGHAHLAGTHLHNTRSGEANVIFAKAVLGKSKAKLFAFSLLEEGLMVAPGNPHRIRTIADLADSRLRLINREPGAALRTLLDDYMARSGIPPSSVTGYDNEVTSHSEGAQMVAFNVADAALGFRAVAGAFGLDFVPIEFVRCDLVIPEDLLDHQVIQILLDTLQSGKLRQELMALPGYESSNTGSIIAEL